jgi:hypothetical protein
MEDGDTQRFGPSPMAAGVERRELVSIDSMMKGEKVWLSPHLQVWWTEGTRRFVKSFQ